ncbi:MAG TPA: glycoside hydrolase family 27 protein [Rhodothermales bacterium]|nr:glycoside hydrolase family 27 protein [Rhodothermales bacterium]
MVDSRVIARYLPKDVPMAYHLHTRSMKRLSFCLLALLLAGTAHAQKFENLALTPPMGWNSWNKFACDGLNEQVVRETADAMVSTGMKDAGYEYIVLDDCWQVSRDSAGNIVPDAQKFPHGIEALADYIHSKGLKFGLYSDAGRKTCQGRPGGRGYEYQDARQYAAWGVDYLKYDWCYTETQNAQASYKLMRDALYQAGRPIVFSICEWGTSKPWEWAADVGNLWRTTGDITPTWDVPSGGNGQIYGGGVLVNLEMQRGLEKYAGPGHWNDPDMLEVGNGDLTAEENKSHFSMWAMLAAPLMAGNDLRNMPDETRMILTNKDVIAIDQDPLGKQAHRASRRDGIETWVKPLSGGNWAVALLNLKDQAQAVTVDWSRYDIGAGYQLRDLWKHQHVGDTGEDFHADIPPHGVVVLKLEKRP